MNGGEPGKKCTFVFILILMSTTVSIKDIFMGKTTDSATIILDVRPFSSVDLPV